MSSERIACCACKASSITVAGEPDLLAVCHCTHCRRRTGSAFGISAHFPREAILRTAGTFTSYAFHHVEMNHDQERFFCAVCGTTLYWNLSSLPTLTGIAGGCFTDLPLAPPGRSYAHSQRLPWVFIPPDWKCLG